MPPTIDYAWNLTNFTHKQSCGLTPFNFIMVAAHSSPPFLQSPNSGPPSEFTRSPKNGSLSRCSPALAAFRLRPALFAITQPTAFSFFPKPTTSNLVFGHHPFRLHCHSHNTHRSITGTRNMIVMPRLRNLY